MWGILSPIKLIYEPRDKSYVGKYPIRFEI